MKNRTLSSRLARTAGVVGASAAVATAGIAAAAGPASASAYATGWQCISPFANFTNGSFPADPPAPNQIIDSLALQVSYGGEALTAVTGQSLPLRDLKLGASLKDPRIAEQLYTRSGGLSVSATNFSGQPLGQPTTDTTKRTVSKVDVDAVTAAAIQPTTTNPGGGTAPAAGESWWRFTVSNAQGTAADLNTGWYSDGAASATGAVTRTYYVQKVDGDKHPQDNAGGFLNQAASIGHNYIAHAGNSEFPINAWVVVEGTNTTERFQTVRATGTWTVSVKDPTPGSIANPAGYTDGGHVVTVPDINLNLSRSNWTPTGAGPVEFRVAEPGHSDAVQIASTGYADRAGYYRPVTVRPFGSVFVRAETESYGANNDCIPGGISVADSTIAASWFGDARPDATDANPDTSVGDVENPGFTLNNAGTGWTVAKGARGRYAFAPVAQSNLTVANLPVVANPGPTPTPAAKPKAVKVTSASLKRSKSNTVSVKVSNPNAKSAKFTVAIKTTQKLRVGKKGPKKLQIAVTPKTVTVGAGKTSTVKLKLSKALRALLKTKKSVGVTVSVTAKDKTLATNGTKKLTLKR